MIGQNVTVSTTDFGPIHGVVIPNLGEINIRFLMGKLSFKFVVLSREFIEKYDPIALK